MGPTAAAGGAVAVDDRASVVLGEVASLDVLENDTVPSSYAPRIVSGPRDRARFTYLGEARGWELEYTAPSALPSSGTETITYQLHEVQIGIAAGGLETAVSPTAVVTVDLAAPAAADDVVVLEQALLGQSELLDVLANDDAPAGAEAVPVSGIAAGPLQWDPTARRIRLDVEDRSVGTATFTYELRLDGRRLDSAEVTVRIRRAEAVPDQVAALPGVQVAVPVLANDRETEGRTVLVPQRSEHGTLRWDERRRVVLYTMDRDHTGTVDRFAYQLGIPFESFVPESSGEVTITRITPPSAPTAVTAERREDGVVVLRWEPPDSDGGSPVTGYHVRDSSPDDETTSLSISLSATARSVEVPRSSGVEDGTLTVVAVNAAGEGPASQVAVPRRPSAPRDLQAVGGPSLIALQWRAPESPGSSPVTGYRVTWDRAGAGGAAGPGPAPGPAPSPAAAGGGPAAGGSLLLPAAAARTVLTGLQDGVPYAVSVEALGAAGAGPAARTTATPRTPVLAADRAVTTALAPVDVAVLANDRDGTAGALSVDALPAGGGRAEVVGSSVRFTPGGPFGRVELTYRLTALGVELASGTLVVEEVDAVDDAAVSLRGGPVPVDVLGNDLVPSGVAARVAGGVGGTLALDATGARFTPAAGFVGTASATYELVVDGRVLDSATVTVEVGVRPDAVDDAATVVAGESVDVAVLANDLGAAGLAPVLVDPVPARQGLQVLPSGAVRYEPPVELSGPVVFRYALVDATESYDVATVTVQVERARPKAVDDTASTPARTPVTVDVRANDLRAEGTTVVLTAFPGATVVDEQVRYAPEPGVVGPVVLTYGLRRGGPVLSTAQVQITIEPPPTARPTTDPSGTSSGAATAPEQDPDPDQDETLEQTPVQEPTRTPSGTPSGRPRGRRPRRPSPSCGRSRSRPEEACASPAAAAGQEGRSTWWSATTPAGSTTADAAGRFSADVPAPSSVGRYVVVASCGDRQVRQTVDVVVTVSSAAGGAAATGGAVVVAGLLAFYVLTGAVLVPRGTSVGAPAAADEDEG